MKEADAKHEEEDVADDDTQTLGRVLEPVHFVIEEREYADDYQLDELSNVAENDPLDDKGNEGVMSKPQA